MGSTRRESTNAVYSLVDLCHPCHAHIESHRTEALDDGWLVTQYCDPAWIPVNARGTWKLLDALGGYQLPD